MSREDLADKLKEEEFGGEGINWQVSPRRGNRMPYAENSRAYFFRMRDTGTIIVQPKSPANAMPTCYSCDGKIITVVRDVHTLATNGEDPISPFYQEWIDRSFPVAIQYCPNCDVAPQGGQRFSSEEEFHHIYGERFREVLPTPDQRIS